MKLWQKDADSLKEVIEFTSGNDNSLDLLLAKSDVLGSLAHIAMLNKINLLKKDEYLLLRKELILIFKSIEDGKFKIDAGVEDIHSQLEIYLTSKIGEVAKKIHSGRSRNDQVLVDIKLFLRNEIRVLVDEIKKLFDLLISKSESHKSDLLPGYTHLQLAMPSSFGLWFGAYAESLSDDLIPLLGAYEFVNKNPLGSGAGYGSSFPLDRRKTTELLGFNDLNYNVVYAQMCRGKTERIVATALTNIATTLSKLAMDVCIYLNQNFGFISFPEELTTGSSIMPHKKNPDVFEIVRARCNSLLALPNEIALITTNLPSGYHRDFQILKEKLFPAFKVLSQCIQITHLMLSNIEIKKNLLEDEKYKYLFSVEEVNKLVLQNVPFRDAYKKIGQDIKSGEFHHSKNISHTHEGSIGNLCNDKIELSIKNFILRFDFKKAMVAEASLLK